MRFTQLKIIKKELSVAFQEQSIVTDVALMLYLAYMITELEQAKPLYQPTFGTVSNNYESGFPSTITSKSLITLTV